MSTFIRLTDYKSADEKENSFLRLENRFIADQKSFNKISGSPIAYWVSDKVKEIFISNNKLGEIAPSRVGMSTGDNNFFVKFWSEINHNKIGFGFKDSESTINSIFKWFPYNKGGEFRKWYGNNDSLVNWEQDGKDIKQKKENDLKEGKITANNSKCWNQQYYFKKGITWSKISSTKFGIRYSDFGYIFSDAGMMAFVDDNHIYYFCSLLSTNLVLKFLYAKNPTMNYQSGDIASLPIIFPKNESIKEKIDIITQQCIDISKEDWDSRETSWDFTKNELIKMSSGRYVIYNVPTTDYDINKPNSIQIIYQQYCEYWKSKFYQLHSNEKELNRLFIDIYELQDELTPDVALKDITILKDETTINDNNELEFKKDNVIKQFISYAVGCMFGRYSLDKEGLILANQGETLQDFLEKIGKDLIDNLPTFTPNENDVIPILDEEYFTSDIVRQFKTFLKASFGEKTYQKNLDFIEEAIGKDIRSYFLKDFYEEHIRRYKKRPIYWFFSSEKGAFSALIYMHRYKNDTASIVLNDYLREYISKLQSKRESLKQISLSEGSSSADKKKADKEITIIDKKLKELDEYEKKLLHIANQKIDIDLDDGVKVNYTKFKEVFYKIKGLEKEG